MKSRTFDRRILKAVSRSFYLSIRVLPSQVRTQIGLAYLLARASDTIADTTTVSIDTRLRRLDDFAALVRGTAPQHAIASIQRDIQPEHKGERALIATLPRVLEAMSTLPAWDWTEMNNLLANIILGQSNDLKTFRSSDKITALENAAALEDYTYLVAGCVGEWWTRVCYHHLPGYSLVPESELMFIANSFGKALQLVNILRDLPVDLAACRCYLPADELAALSVEPHELSVHPHLAQAVVDTWIDRARTLLDQARFYISAVRVRRIRLACYLPWRLADQTLDILQQRSPLSTKEKLKVPRSAVRSALWSGIRVAFFNKTLA